MRVLLADDEPLMLKKLNMLVEKALPGEEFTAFSDPARLQEWLAGEPFVDVAFLDINMRMLDGITVARALREVNPHVNVIFCTGYSDYALNALDVNCSGYLLKPITLEMVRREVSSLRYPVHSAAPAKRMQLRCFGGFSAAVDGAEVRFAYEKTREMLAYLVDRRGAMCANSEIKAALWEDGRHSEYLKSLRKDLLKTLRELGCEDVLESQHGGLRVVPERVSCDYYDYLDGSAPLPGGEYMKNYEFAEDTRELLETS